MQSADGNGKADRDALTAEESRFARQRRALVEEITAEVAATEQWTGRAALDPLVMEALAAVPRHEFVPVEERAYAYVNHALGIGWGQTISQPYIVALMTDLLSTAADHVVLEIGTGSGYQAAVLSRLVRRVYSVEVVESLSHQAAATLGRLGYANVTVRTGDGAAGWPEHAPFDGIIVTAAAPAVPPALIAQLKTGARLVMPLGDRGGQILTVLEKKADGAIEETASLAVAFVPLTAPGAAAPPATA